MYELYMFFIDVDNGWLLVKFGGYFEECFVIILEMVFFCC